MAAKPRANGLYATSRHTTPQSTTLGLHPVIHVPNYMDQYSFTDPWGMDGWDNNNNNLTRSLQKQTTIKPIALTPVTNLWLSCDSRACTYDDFSCSCDCISHSLHSVTYSQHSTTRHTFTCTTCVDPKFWVRVSSFIHLIFKNQLAIQYTVR